MNLVFQGGGVRGVAYAGALECMPPECKVHSVAGTSAGSIVAGLLALGRTTAQIREILESKELLTLVDTSSGEGGDVLRVLADARKTFGNGISLWPAFKFYRRHKDKRGAFESVGARRGLFSSRNVRKWLDATFSNATFSDIRIPGDLRIVAADLKTCEYKIFSKRTHPGELLANAIHASISIPRIMLSTA